MEENMKIPNHVAIILDGNGRWAKSKGMPRNYGHVQGAKTVEVICEEAYRMGIQYLTVYAFSTENWNRPQDEVDALMGLLRNYMKTCLKTAAKNNMCVRVLGEKSRLDSYTTSVMCSKTVAGSSTRTPMSTWLFNSSRPNALHWLANHSAPDRPGAAIRKRQDTSPPLASVRR